MPINVQEAYRTPNRLDQKRKSSCHIIMKTLRYTFFSAPHGNFSRTFLMRDHKASLNSYRTGITPCILPDNHGLKLEFNNRHIRKPTYLWKQTTLYSVTNGSRKKLKTLQNSMKIRAQHNPNLCDTMKQVLRALSAFMKNQREKSQSTDSMQFPSKFQHNSLQTLKEQFSTSQGKTKNPGQLKQSGTIKEFLEISPSLLSSCTTEQL